MPLPRLPVRPGRARDRQSRAGGPAAGARDALRGREAGRNGAGRGIGDWNGTMRPPEAGASLFAGRTLLRRMARVCRCLFGFVLPGAWPVGPACRLVRGQGRQNGIRLPGCSAGNGHLTGSDGSCTGSRRSAPTCFAGCRGTRRI